MASQKTYDAIIIGGGIVGCGLAYYLAREGLERLVVLEKDELGAGATGGSFGNVRQQFGSASEIECSRRGLAFWKGAESQFGISCPFHQDGYLMVTSDVAKAETLQKQATLQRAMGMTNVHLLTPSEILDVAPFLDVRGLLTGSWTPDDGHVMAMDGVVAFHSAAREMGVTFRTRCRVHRVMRETSGWRVSYEGDDISAPKVFIAAGGGSRSLLAPFGVDIDIGIFPHHSLITEPAYVGERVPFVVDLDLGMAVERDGESLVLAMLDRHPPARNHDELIERFSAAAAERAPALRELGISHRVTAQQPLGGDGMPYVGEVEDGLWVSAFVGHGVMHGPPIAEAVARASVGRPDSGLDMEGWNPRRAIGQSTVLWRKP